MAEEPAAQFESAFPIAPLERPLVCRSALSAVAYRTEVFENASVKGSEFLRKVKAVARRNKLTYRWAPERGSGSHGTVYVGSKFTVVKDLKKELGPGLLSDMLRQIGIRKEDL
jgi:mRNA interferase HicA